MSETLETDVIDRVMENPGLVLDSATLFETFYTELEKAVTSVKGDVKTVGGRELIASTAFRVVKARTGIEGARKAKTEHWRKETTRVNGVGNIYKEKLLALQERVAAPLTKWQAAEDARVASCQETFDFILHARQISFGVTAADLDATLTKIRGINDLVPEIFGDKYADTLAARDETLEILTRGHAILLKAEADAAELAALKAEQERQGEEARQQAAQIMAEARRKDEDARIAQARLEAAEQAKADAEAAAERKLEEQKRAHQEELDRLAREKSTQNAAEAGRIAAQQARETDEAYKRSVHTKMARALSVNVPMPLVQARLVVVTILDGKVPNLRVDY